MIETDYRPNELPAQALVKLPLNDLPPANPIEEYRASERGDFRVTAALLTIERECAEIDQGTAPVPSVPPPAINTCAYPDDGSPPDFEASATVSPHAAADAIAATERGKAIIDAIRASSRAPRRTIPKPAAPRRALIKPPMRSARAVHSHTAHGGARKTQGPRTGSGDSGGGEPPPPRWGLIADRSWSRIEVAAIETVSGLATFRKDETTGKPWIETTGATRAEALAKLSRMVRERGGHPAWEDYA